MFFNKTMTQHTSRCCKGYLTKKESDGVLHQMTWPPQSLDLNPIEKVLAELDCREGKAANKCSAYVGTPSRLLVKAFQVKLVKRMPRVCKAVVKAKDGNFEHLKSKLYFDLFNTFLYV